MVEHDNNPVSREDSLLPLFQAAGEVNSKLESLNLIDASLVSATNEHQEEEDSVNQGSSAYTPSYTPSYKIGRAHV